MLLRSKEMKKLRLAGSMSRMFGSRLTKYCSLICADHTLNYFNTCQRLACCGNGLLFGSDTQFTGKFFKKASVLSCQLQT